MDTHKDEHSFDDATPPTTPADRPPTSRKTRILALLGAIFMIALTLLYAYSVATGKIFAF